MLSYDGSKHPGVDSHLEAAGLAVYTIMTPLVDPTDPAVTTIETAWVVRGITAATQPLTDAELVALAEPVLAAYTVEDARGYRKLEIDLNAARQFDRQLQAAYGFIPPAQQMIMWPTKRVEADAWQAWFDGGQVGPEPVTPTLDAEVTVLQPRATRVAKVQAKAAALDGLRAAIEGNSVALKESIDAATTFAEVAAVITDAGWPA